MFMQTQVPNGANPLAVAAYVAGFLLSIPVATALVKAIYFFANITNNLDNVVNGLSSLVEEMKEYRHNKNGQLQTIELTIELLKRDVNTLQTSQNMAPTQWPEPRNDM